MRVLVAPHDFGSLLHPRVAAEALATGWRTTRPDDEVLTHPMSDGSAGFLDAISASGHAPAPGSAEVLTVGRGRLAHPVPVLRVPAGGELWHTVYAHTASFGTDSPVTSQSLALASSARLGELLATVCARGARRIVLGVGQAPWHDGGSGLLEELARGLGLATQLPQSPTRDDRVGLLAPVREALTGIEIVLASADDLPLRGLHGAGAALANLPGISLADAQDIEHLAADFVAGVDEAAPALEPRDLLAPASVPLHSRRPHSGSGGGAAFVLAALGARVLPGAWVVAEETGLANRLAGVDVVVTGAGIVAGHELSVGVVAEVAERAQPHAIPVIVVGGQIDATPRQLNKVGVHASYPVVAPLAGRPQLTAAPPTESGLIDRGARLARTWSRG